MLQLVREYGGGQSLRDVILHGNRVVEVVVGNKIQDRSERLGLNDWPLIACHRNRGRHEVARPFEAFAAAHDFATSRADRCAGSLYSSDSLVVDQWAHQGAGVERITDTHLRISAYQCALEFFEACLLYENPTRGRTALACRAHGAENDRRYRELKVGMLIDNDCIIAAEF